MKLKLLNIFQSQGISKKDNRPFAMQRATILAEFEPVNAANYQRNGIGFGVVEIGIAETFYPELEKHVAQNFKGQLLELDLRTSVGRRGEVIIAGFEAPAAVSFPKTGTTG